MNTATVSNTTTVTAVGHLQVVMKQLSIELSFLKNAYRGAHYSFEVEKVICDLQIMVLNDVIRSAAIQYHHRDNLVLEHRYVVSEEPIDTWGVSAEETPLADIPDGLTVRFVVQPNPNQPADYVDEWLTRLGYYEVDALIVPENAVSTTYGSYASGGFGVSRTQIVDPRYSNRQQTRRSDFAIKEISQ